MSEIPIKKSNWVAGKTKVDNYISDADKDLKNIFSYLSIFPVTITQSTEPTLTEGSFGFWKDSDDSKTYLILNIGGTQTKVELT